MRACLVCGEKATVQFKNQPKSTFCGESCARFHFIGVKRDRQDVPSDAREAATELVTTAMEQGHLNFIITGPAMEKATIYLGDKGWGDTDNEQPNFVGDPDFYGVLRHIVETQFSDDASIHSIDFDDTTSGGIIINDIESITKEDLINLFYNLWVIGGYRWTTPPVSEQRTFYHDDERGGGYQMDSRKYQRFLKNQ